MQQSRPYQGRRQEFTEGVSSRLGLLRNDASARSMEIFLDFTALGFQEEL